MNAAIATRFWSKVDKSGECWEWKAGRSSTGYGNFSIKHKTFSAHRLAYELIVGPIPDGLHIDHLCRNRGCVNPAHMEPVSVRENLLRGETHAAVNAAKTHCPQRHPYNPANTVWLKNGGRACLICKRARWHRWNERRQMRAAGVAA